MLNKLRTLCVCVCVLKVCMEHLWNNCMPVKEMSASIIQVVFSAYTASTLEINNKNNIKVSTCLELQEVTLK